MKSLLLLSTVFLHGSLLAQQDPYIWLEDVEGEASMEWVMNQNKKSEDRLTKVEGFDALKEQFLTVYNDKDKIAFPSSNGNFIYNFWKDDAHVRGIWRRMKRTDYLAKKEQWEVILDLDALSEKEGVKWVFHGATWLEPDNAICLLALSDGGTDEDEIREFDVDKKEFIKDGFFLPSGKGNAAWVNKDELLISRVFGDGTATESGYPRMVKRWKRGTPLSDAKVVFEIPDTLMGVWVGSEYVDGTCRLYINKANSFYSQEFYELQDKGIMKYDLPDDIEQNGRFGDKIIATLQSDWNIDGQIYSAGSLVCIDRIKLLAGEHDLQLILKPDEKSTVDGVSITKQAIIVNMLVNVQSVMYEFTYDKEWKQRKIDAPELGTITVIDANDKQTGYFYLYNNFITPSTLYYSNGENSEVFKKQKEQFNAEGLVVEQQWVTSKDGTKVPYFIVRHKDIEYKGSNPTLVYAYGGFNISNKPGYRTSTGIGWLEKGGVYVVANIRGGGEFGPEWHHGAQKEKRQNAYDDFYAVCEDLIARKITSPDHLGAFGWSNGGLMAGVVATQRPDLFNAVIVGAPLLDMKRFNKMLAGASWMGEYGNPDLEEDWAYIQKYSPYHNVHADKKYPEVFIVTSTKDDRVHPAHARKMAARMMEQGHPLFYYETVEGGHGAASTNEQSAKLESMMYSYLRLKLMD